MALNVVIRHVHGSWLDAFVRGPHRYLLPVEAGSNRAGRRPDWPASAVDVDAATLAHEAVDVVVLQRPDEFATAASLIAPRRLGADVPVVYLEHNVPQGRINDMRHPFADRDDVTLVHVTHFNALFWDTGSTRTRVIEHGIPDPGDRYTGRLERIAVVINEAERRARVTGTDLLPRFAAVAPLDRYGIGTAHDLPLDALHARIAQRRLYLHPFRWTSLGLALLEAMACGMPVVALGTTEVPFAVPAGAGIVSNDPQVLIGGIRRLMRDPDAARELGARGRAHVLQHYGLARFLHAWDLLLMEVVAGAYTGDG